MPEPEDSRVAPHVESSRRTSRACAVFVALLSGCVAGCTSPDVEVDPETAEGQAVQAALEHEAARWWEEEGTTLVEGRVAVAYRGEEQLSGPTSSFLDDAFEQRGWRWSTEDPLVPTGNCAFPFGDCRLKDPTELHLTLWVKPWPGEEDYRSPPWPPPGPPEFLVEPIAGLEGYKVHLTWLSSFPRSDGHRADQGGAGFLVTPGTDGWAVEVVMTWDT